VIATPERPFPQLQNHGSADVKGGFLWLIELSNGQYCADDTGASLYFPSIGRANWDCPTAWAGAPSTETDGTGQWHIPASPWRLDTRLPG
jgi:hypothetical protein